MATNIVNPGKKSKDGKAKQRVLKIYKTQDEKNDQRFQSQLKKAQAYDKKVKSGGSKWQTKGKPSEEHLRQSWLIGNKASKVSETGNVMVRKESGEFNSSPPVAGGTKKMIRISRKNVRNNAASKQAKASAKKLY